MIKDYITVLKSLHYTKTEKIPERKQELVNLFSILKDSTPIQINEQGNDIDLDNDSVIYNNIMHQGKDVDNTIAI